MEGKNYEIRKGERGMEHRPLDECSFRLSKAEWRPGIPAFSEPALIALREAIEKVRSKSKVE
jgi:hypothetical protein